MKQVSGDYELRRIAELREKYIRDEQATLDFAIEKGLKQGMEQGIEQGIEQGAKQEKINVAKNMLELNIEIEKIEKVTGLVREEILKLK